MKELSYGSEYNKERRPIYRVRFPWHELAKNEGRITRKIVYEIFVISKSQDFFERFLGFLRDFGGFFGEFLIV